MPAPPHPYLNRPSFASPTTHLLLIPPPPPSSSAGASHHHHHHHHASFVIDDGNPPVDDHRYSCDAWLHYNEDLDYGAAQPPAAAAAPDPARISFSSDVNHDVGADANDSRSSSCSSRRSALAPMDAAANAFIVMHGGSSNGSGAADGSPARLLPTGSSYKGSSPPTSEFEFSMGDNIISTSDLQLSSSGSPDSPTCQVDSRPLRERQRHPCLAAADELFCDGKLLPLYSSAQYYGNYYAPCSNGGVLNQEAAPIRRRSNAGETTYDYYIHCAAGHDNGTGGGVSFSDHYGNHRPAAADEPVVRPPAAAAADHPISPKAPTCTSRWKELLGLKKGGSSSSQISTSDQDHLVCSTRSRSLHHHHHHHHAHASSSNSKPMLRSSDFIVNRILQQQQQPQAPPLVPGRRSLDSCNTTTTTASNNSSSSSTSFRAGLQRLAPFQAIHRHSTAHNNNNNNNNNDDCSDSDPAGRILCPTMTSCTRGQYRSASSDLQQVCDRSEPAAADHRTQLARLTSNNNNNHSPANEQSNGLNQAMVRQNGCSRSNNWRSKAGMANAKLAAPNHDRSATAGNNYCGAPKQQQQPTGTSYSSSSSKGRVLHRSYSGPLKPSAAARGKQAPAISCGKQQINLNNSSSSRVPDPITHQNARRAAALERSSSYSAAGFRVTPVIHVPLYMITPGLMRTKLGAGGTGSSRGGGGSTTSSYGSILGGLAQTVFSSRS